MSDQKPSVFLAMPVYRDINAFTCQALVKLVAEQMANEDFSLSMKMHIGECPIGRARNDLTHEFLQSGYSHLLFVDSDIVFSYEQVKKIVNSGKDIVGGFYVKKQEGKANPVVNTLSEVGEPDENGLLKVKYAGTGFLCITRKVFETMVGKKPDLQYFDDRDGKTIKHDFWRMGVDTDCVLGVKRWLSEDWQFCQYAIQCGFEIWMDARILLQHAGQVMFPLQTQLPDLYSPAQMKRMNLPIVPVADSQLTSDSGETSIPIKIET